MIVVVLILGQPLHAASSGRNDQLETLASAQFGPQSLAVDATNIYWTNKGTFNGTSSYNNDGTVARLPLRGGAITTLATKQSRPTSIAVDSSSVYWINPPLRGGDGSMVSYSLAAGTVATLATTSYGFHRLTIDSHRILATSWNGTVTSRNTDGTGVQAVHILDDMPEGITSVDEAIFWADTDDGTVLRASGGSVATLASRQRHPSSIAADRTNVYWINNDTGEGTGSIMKVSQKGGEPTVLASNQSNPYGIATDGQNIYWSNKGPASNLTPVPNTGTIMKISPDGGAAITIASGQMNPTAIAVDNTSVYWTNSGAAGLPGGSRGDGTVMRFTPK